VYKRQTSRLVMDLLNRRRTAHRCDGSAFGGG